MRLRFVSIVGLSAGAILLFVGLAGLPAFAVSGFLDAPPDGRHPWDQQIRDNTRQLVDQGRETFRYDTFGSETFFGNAIKLHQALEGDRFGGVGPGEPDVVADPPKQRPVARSLVHLSRL